jgi:hypothetical protein
MAQNMVTLDVQECERTRNMSIYLVNIEATSCFRLLPTSTLDVWKVVEHCVWRLNEFGCTITLPHLELLLRFSFFWMCEDTKQGHVVIIEAVYHFILLPIFPLDVWKVWEQFCGNKNAFGCTLALLVHWDWWLRFWKFWMWERTRHKTMWSSLSVNHCHTADPHLQ